VESLGGVNGTRMRTLARLSVSRPFRRAVLRSPATALAWIGLAFFVLIAIFGPLLVSADPNDQAYEPLLAPFSSGHLLGTDALGRDQLSRLAYGARPLIMVSLASVALAVAIGGVIGLAAGYYGRWAETVLMRTMDAILAFPVILLALLIIVVTGTGIVPMIIAIAASQIPVFARLVRALVARERAREYVLAARAAGFSNARIIRTEILRNVAGPTIVQAMSTLAVAAGFASAFSYLGVGVQPPTSDWGYMVKDGQQYVFSNWELAVFPGLAITFFVVSCNFAGDSLRDLLDLRSRGRL
jgi:peptide/nickel transport system permease protein